jgi:16S rRNA (guanine966-N2)-methyltransferase
MTGKVRIIGGRFRGKALPVIDQNTLRPTPNRIRETLFNWLMHDIRDTVCLDAFAGSGALGLEAFSRGAKQVVLIEKDAVVFKQLKHSVLSFNSEQLSCYQQSFFDFLHQTSLMFDLVFLDPPFQEAWLVSCLEKLAASPVLKPNGLVYLESNHPLPEAEPAWKIIKSGKAASIYFGLYKKK